MRNFISYLAYGFKNKKFSPLVLLIDTVLFVIGLTDSAHELASKPTITVLLTVVFINIIWQIYSCYSELFRYFKTDFHNESSDSSADYSKYADDKSKMLKIGDNAVSYCDELNDELIYSNPDFRIDEKATEKVNSYIRSNFDSLLPFLSKHYTDSQTNKKMFRNDKKLCLSGKLSLKKPVKIAKGCYYNTYLTNKIFSKMLICDDSPNVYPVLSCSNTHLKLPYEYFSNEIGISTLAITNDGSVFFQVQGTHADSSAGLIVPSGSGSADWADYRNNRFTKFKDVIDFSTIRELREEAGLTNKAISIDNRVIGFFRWLNYGGKPEFISISRIDCNITDITPQRQEQRGTLRDEFVFDIINDDGTLNEDELNRCFAYMDSPNCSVPLYMNILFLKNYYENRKSDFMAFLLKD